MDQHVDDDVCADMDVRGSVKNRPDEHPTVFNTSIGLGLNELGH